MQVRQRTYEVTLRFFSAFNIPVGNREVLNINSDTAWTQKFDSTKKERGCLKFTFHKFSKYLDIQIILYVQ